MDDTTLDAIEARQKAAASARWEIIGDRVGPRALMALLGEDVPALVAEVRRLTEENTIIDRACVRRLDQSIAWMERAEAAEAEVVTLRAKVAAVQALAEKRDVLYPPKFTFDAATNYVNGYRQARADFRAALSTGEGE